MSPGRILSRCQLNEKLLILRGNPVPRIGFPNASRSASPILGRYSRMIFNMLQLCCEIERIALEEDAVVLQDLRVKGRIQGQHTITRPKCRQQ